MNVNGYDAIYLEDFPAYAASSEGRPAADPSRSYLSRPESKQMKQMDVACVINIHGGCDSVSGALPLASLDGSTRSGISLSILRPEHWVAYGQVLSGARRILLSLPHYPGWRARVDGKPVEIEAWDGLLSALPLPPTINTGQRIKVDLIFQPTYWPLLTTVAAGSWILWLAMGVAVLP